MIFSLAQTSEYYLRHPNKAQMRKPFFLVYWDRLLDKDTNTGYTPTNTLYANFVVYFAS